MAKHSKPDPEKSTPTTPSGGSSKKNKISDSKNRYKEMFSKISDIDDNLLDSGGFKSFRSDGYENEIGEETPRQVEELDDGTIIAIPELVKNWRCRYFYSPGYKAHLFRTIFLFILIIVMLVFFLFTTAVPRQVGFTLAIVLVFFVNILFRYYDLALYNQPMPMVPGASLFFYKLFTNEYKDHHEEEGNEEESREREGYVVNEVSIDPINNVKNGNPSPATVLTRWMNSSDVRWSAEDIIEKSGGVIDKFTLKMLLKDNGDAWADEEVIDTLSIITGSNPIQWQQTYEKWLGD